MRTVPLHGKKAAGRVALVDDEDYDLVMQYRWHASEQVRSRRTVGPYAVATIRISKAEARSTGRPVRTGLLMHKLITGWPETDHIDHNGLNNQRYNLRPGHGGLNNRNQHGWAGHSSRYKGVTWHPATAKWRARIQVNKKIISLGLYPTEEEAALAYDRAAREHFGAYALPNFPEAA